MKKDVLDVAETIKSLNKMLAIIDSILKTQDNFQVIANELTNIVKKLDQRITMLETGEIKPNTSKVGLA